MHKQFFSWDLNNWWLFHININHKITVKNPLCNSNRLPGQYYHKHWTEELQVNIIVVLFFFLFTHFEFGFKICLESFKHIFHLNLVFEGLYHPINMIKPAHVQNLMPNKHSHLLSIHSTSFMMLNNQVYKEGEKQ